MGNNNVFGGLFGNGNLSDAQRNFENQLMQYQKLQEAQKLQDAQGTNQLGKFKEIISELSQDEQMQLSKVSDFVNARQLYEAGFIDFLGSKFAGEYIQTPVGKQAIENLNESAKSAVKKIKDTNKERIEKLEAMAALLESDPEIQKKLQEKINSNGNK